jgi:hypothetical protein
VTAFLIDTNVLLRYVEKGVAEHPEVCKAIEFRLSRGDVLCVTPQVLSVHGVSHILTFNTADFAQVEGVVALAPTAMPGT